MDFSAFYEVYLGGRWWPMDARHGKARVGRVLMARGRDAADVALVTTFGRHRLTKFVVITDEILSHPMPITPTTPLAMGAQRRDICGGSISAFRGSRRRLSAYA